MNDDSNESSPRLLHQWTIAGIISAGANFIPVPFVDDLVQNRCRRFVIDQTLVAHQSTLTVNDMASFYSTSDGCMAGCLGMLLRAPLKILMFPIRKVITVVTSVRSVPLEIMRMVLLGRTLDRYLQTGKLRESDSQALAMRTAFEIAFAQMDWRAVRAAIKDALGTVDHWKDSAIGSAKRTLDRKDEMEQLESQPAVEESAQQVEKVWRRSETLALFTEFDRRFDDAMQSLKDQRSS